VAVSPPKDAIDQAIADASQPEVKMAQFGLQLSSGRPAGLMVPEDISDVEWLSLIGGLLKIGDSLRAKREASQAPTLLRAPAIPGLRSL